MYRSAVLLALVSAAFLVTMNSTVDANAAAQAAIDMALKLGQGVLDSINKHFYEDDVSLYS